MTWGDVIKGKGERHFYIENGKPVQWIGETHKHPDGTLMSGKEHKEGVSKKLFHFYELKEEHLRHLSKDTTVIKAPSLTPEEQKEIQALMRFENLSQEEAEKRVRKKAGKIARGNPAVGRFVKSDWKDVLKFKRRFKKVVRNKKTGRTRTVKYGQAGKAKDGGDRIRPSTKKGDAYCARSMGIKRRLPKEKRNDPNSPNNLSRKKWKCRGTKSMR